MMHITEDTPPDMLSGAMDLTVHLPTGRSVKMCVERSTPMMDLLVQITTNHHLQLSNYTLQALHMAPTSDYLDKVLPYKPNTPIGALDPQHIKVVPKSRSIPVPKNVPPGHQPFESTFRLKVHLPRNQLYVTRVSRNVYLEDILNKVCEEKNLDPAKYEFRHPGNLDQVLDPKLTLYDYQITEICLVSKGSSNLSQTFSTNDIMALRKEEERKQMHNKTGGGVLNLIFRRGRSSTGSGSVSTENCSISPVQSDDSRSVTPPTVQPHFVTPCQQISPDKPKAPQRKRRPAPKPPQVNGSDSLERKISSLSDNSSQGEIMTKLDNGITICHSRNSSDSSGYHETSILSEHCNTSLPRRAKAQDINENVEEPVSRHSSTSNLTKMAPQSKSTSSLAFSGRKKKAAPPPPLKSASSVTTLQSISPVVASQTPITQSESQDIPVTTTVTNPNPAPRRKKAPPVPRPRSLAPGKITDVDNSFRRNTIQNMSIEETILEELYKNGDETKSSIDTIESEEFRSSIDTNLSEEFRSSYTSNVSYYEQKNSEISEDTSEIEIDGNSVKFSIGSSKLSDDNVSFRTATNEDTDSNTSIGHRKLSNANNKDQNIPNIDKTDCSSNELIEDKSSVAKTNVHNLEETELLHHKNIEDKDGTTDESNSLVNENKEIEDVELHFNILAGIQNEEMATENLNEVASEILKDAADISGENSRQLEVAAVLSESKLEESEKTISENDATVEVGDSISKESSMIISNKQHVQENYNENNDALIPSQSSAATENLGTIASEIKNEEKVNKIQDNVSHTESIIEDNNTEANLLKERQLRKLYSTGSLGITEGVFTNGHLIKWRNSENLDEISIISEGGGNLWLNESDTESLSSLNCTEYAQKSSNISATELQRKPSLKDTRKDSKTSLTSLQSSPDKLPSLNNHQNHDLTDSANNYNGKVSPLQAKASSLSRSTSLITDIITPKPLTSIPTIPDNSISNLDTTEINHPDLENEWHYQLPAPPKAFRDSSPVKYAPTVTDSVVTSPELFEKLKQIQDLHSEQQSTCDVASIASEDKVILSKLSLENLEKRKSLVYNRELATSLKMTDVNNDKTTSEPAPKLSLEESYSSCINQFHKTLQDIQRSSQQAEETSRKIQDNATQSILPNFKITTYNPKQNINIFEDDTIYSNAEASKRNSLQRRESFDLQGKNLRHSYAGQSLENISIRNGDMNGNYDSDGFRKPLIRNNVKYIKRFGNLNRSESFKAENSEWTPSKPVTRSKSQAALNKYNEDKLPKLTNGDKSSSLFDLQSLEVIRVIQNKLNTPSASVEQINRLQPEPKEEVLVPKTIPQKMEQPTTKIYTYSGPPSINMTTWSERPKVPVSVKEDADYKLGIGSNNLHTKVIVNTHNTVMKSSNSIESRNTTTFDSKFNQTHSTSSLPSTNFSNKFDSKNVSIKVNGSESISAQKSGNVLIKIGDTDTRYRRPLGTLNKNSPRPHSIAIPSDSDISRVPIVRSVEFKKPYKDFQNNTSITHLNQDDNKNHEDMILNGFNGNLKNNRYSSTENLNSPSVETASKQVFRTNSFVQGIPTVKGFRPITSTPLTTTNNRHSWLVGNNYSTLPNKPVIPDTKPAAFETNKNVPFSRFNLKRTESSKFIKTNTEEEDNANMVFTNNLVNKSLNALNNNYSNNNHNNTAQTEVSKSKKPSAEIVKPTSVPPPPPEMPKLNNGIGKRPIKQLQPTVDPRDELLKSIRDFGGKKGLRSVRAH